MKFSIVVPLRNQSAFITEALGSVLGQTCRDFEVIVVDSGWSNAGTDVARALRDPRIRTDHQETPGIAAARNHGIQLARGEWVCFLDADDRLHPIFLESQLRAIRQHPHASFVATGYRIVPATEWKARIDHWPVPRAPDRFELIDDLPSRWMKSPTFSTGSVAIRRSLLQELQPCFVDDEPAGEDLDFLFRVAERSVIVFNPAPLQACRMPGRSAACGPTRRPARPSDSSRKSASRTPATSWPRGAGCRRFACSGAAVRPSPAIAGGPPRP